MNTKGKTTDQDYRSKRYIAYARCASTQGAPTRLQKQIRLIRRFGDSLQMLCVGEVRVAGVSGRLPVIREDLRQLLARKRVRNDFDVLVMEELSRLTRTGLEGGKQIEREFEK